MNLINMQVSISRIEEIVGDDEVMKKMLIEMFVKSCEKSIAALEQNLHEQNPEKEQKDWHDINHDLKGSAYNLGFQDLGDYCAAVEKENLSNERKAEIIEIYKQAKKQVEEML